VQYSDLPQGEEIVRSSAATQIGYGLSLALMPEERYIGHMPAMGGPSSCRVFVTAADHPDAVPCGDSVRTIVASLLQYLHATEEGAESARMPEDKPRPLSQKGWSIRKATIDGCPAAIATAIWLD